MSQPDEAVSEEAPRRPPREGLGFVLVKMGRAGPPFEPRRRPQAGKSGDPRSQNADNDEPTNYEEPMMIPDSAKWLEAMKSEMGSMYENKVWTLIDLPDDRQAIENKGIFKKKTDADGNVTIYKARLVAKGF